MHMTRPTILTKHEMNAQEMLEESEDEELDEVEQHLRANEERIQQDAHRRRRRWAVPPTLSSHALVCVCLRACV